MTPPPYLPEEIWADIVHYVSHEALPKLAVCSRTLHRLATMRLYCCVLGNNCWATCPGDLGSFQQSTIPIIPGNPIRTSKPCSEYYPPYEPTYIHDLLRFCQTVKTSQNLRELIEVADLNLIPFWQGYQWDIPHSELPCLLPSVRSLRLQTNGFPIDFAPMRKLESLKYCFRQRTHMPEERNSQGEPYDLGPTYIHSIFSLPFLTSLTLTSTEGWDYDNGTARNLVAGISNVTRLALSFDGEPVSWLTEILSWPKALELLHVEYKPDVSEELTEAIDKGFRRVSAALCPHRESLKELIIIRDERDLIVGAPPKAVQDDFPHLERYHDSDYPPIRS